MAAGEEFAGGEGVESPVGVVVGGDDGAGERDTGEEALASGIREYLGLELGVGGCLGGAADRAGCCGGFAADLEAVFEKVLQAVVGHEKHYEVGGRSADLKTYAAAGEFEKRRSAPALAADTTNYHALAALAADYERALDDAGKYRNGFRSQQQVFGNGFVGDRHYVVERLCRLLRGLGGVSNFPVNVALGKCRCSEQQSECKDSEWSKDFNFDQFSESPW